MAEPHQLWSALRAAARLLLVAFLAFSLGYAVGITRKSREYAGVPIHSPAIPEASPPVVSVVVQQTATSEPAQPPGPAPESATKTRPEPERTEPRATETSATVVLGAPAPPRSAAPPPVRAPMHIAAARSWAYQLQRVRTTALHSDRHDVLAVDMSRDGSDARAFGAADVARLKRRPSEPDRIVLAYLSIGEAEEYRDYWNRAWVTLAPAMTPRGQAPARSQAAPQARSTAASQRTGQRRPVLLPAKARRGPPPATAGIATPASAGIGALGLRVPSAIAPDWLDQENPEWRGNFRVRYWSHEWQTVLFGTPEAYLDRIIAAGFDGVYLDRIDVYEDWQQARPGADREMVGLVKALAAYARARRPGFLIVPQNAEELLGWGDYRQAIDAVAKEDLLYNSGPDGSDGHAVPEKDIAWSRNYLDLARREGKPVLAVEYLDRPELIEGTRARLTAYGYLPFFASRALDRID